MGVFRRGPCPLPITQEDFFRTAFFALSNIVRQNTSKYAISRLNNKKFSREGAQRMEVN